ncbi:MAG: CBS domain-containing protein [Candidatus Aenigmatarchaeota archaeon]|nr:CBS domain-containing protein [Candidatus Aenigmarchaeota archaeon]
MPTGIKVSEAMVSRVITARPSQTVMEGSRLMRDEDVGMLVICEGNRPVGVVTREDIVDKVTALDKQASKVTLKEIMGSPVVTCSPDDDLADAAKVMVKHGFERLPVVRMGKLVGLISDREIAKVAPAAIEILRERLLMSEPPPTIEEFNSGDCELCGNFSEALHLINDRWVCDSCKDEASEL